MSDGELDAGNTWEAALFAAKEKLRNLIAIVDRNGIQVSGGTEKVLPLEPLADKWRAFGWRTAEIDGHNFGEIIGAVEETKARNLGSNRSDLKSGERFDLSRPTVIIAKTIPGKGVPIFEGKGEWHSRIPTAEEGRTALASLV
jgi:transketolase